MERTTHRSTRKKRGTLYAGVLAALVLFPQALTAQIYVSPTGDDTNPGTIDLPFLTLPHAFSVAGPDSLIYMRGGVYAISTTVSTTKNGLAGQPIKVWAYPGETPVLDFSGEALGSRGIQIQHSYWYFQGLEIKNAGDNGIYISGGYNRVERCSLHGNKDSGLQISGGGHHNMIINCDSYTNYDSATHGGNADGFAPKLTVGAGNEFHGCRSWNNSDDGWDCYGASYASTIDSCWTFRNGVNIWGDPSFAGNGNGFKVGGNYTIAPHVLTNCVAFDNVVKGFDQNHNRAGVTIYNCTSWRNQRNYWFPDTLLSGMNIAKNNVSYQATSTPVNFNARFSELAANSWSGFTVTNADFLSFDTSLATAPRGPGGSLPVNDFLRLAPASSLIDAGVDVGLPYNGTAPDLGAFETGTASSYFLTVNAANGSVLKNPDQPTYPSGTSVQLTAVPATGFHFVTWSGDASGSLNPTSIIMDKNKTVTANFAINQYALSVTAANGTVIRNPNQAFYDSNSVVQLTAVPATGYTFVNWTGDTTASANPLSLTMDRNKSLTAHFTIKRYTLSISAVHGSVAKLPDQSAYDSNTVVELTAQPSTGYHFANWGGDAGGTQNPLSLTMNSDKTITALFSPDALVVTVSSGWNMVSLPCSVDDPRRTVLFPRALGPAFFYDPGVGYSASDTLRVGLGYWMKFPGPEDVGIAGSPVTLDTLTLSEGWNLIGTLSSPVPVVSIEVLPPGIVQSSFFVYNGTYMESDTLVPGRSYWVKASSSGKLVLVSPAGSEHH